MTRIAAASSRGGTELAPEVEGKLQAKEWVEAPNDAVRTHQAKVRRELESRDLPPAERGAALALAAEVAVVRRKQEASRFYSYRYLLKKPQLSTEHVSEVADVIVQHAREQGQAPPRAASPAPSESEGSVVELPHSVSQAVEVPDPSTPAAVPLPSPFKAARQLAQQLAQRLPSPALSTPSPIRQGTPSSASSAERTNDSILARMSKLRNRVAAAEGRAATAERESPSQRHTPEPGVGGSAASVETRAGPALGSPTKQQQHQQQQGPAGGAPADGGSAAGGLWQASMSNEREKEALRQANASIREMAALAKRGREAAERALGAAKAEVEGMRRSMVRLQEEAAAAKAEAAAARAARPDAPAPAVIDRTLESLARLHHILSLPLSLPGQSQPALGSCYELLRYATSTPLGHAITLRDARQALGALHPDKAAVFLGAGAAWGPYGEQRCRELMTEAFQRVNTAKELLETSGWLRA